MSVVSGIFQSEATKDAADTAAGSAKDASALQYKMFLEQQASMEPWRESGYNALNQLNALMGLPQVQQQRTTAGERDARSTRFIPESGSQGPMPESWSRRDQNIPTAAGAGAATALRSGGPSRLPAERQTAGGTQDWRSLMDPGYEFRKQEGINALAAAGAASGNYGSGNMGVALQDFGQNLASQEFQNVYNRLAGMSGTGQVQSQQIGSLGVNTGGVMANYLNQAGQNIAQGQIASANALAGGARDLEKGIASYYMYGGGGGGGAANPNYYESWDSSMWGP